MPRCVLSAGECDGCMECYERLNDEYETDTETEQDEEEEFYM